MYLYWKTKLQHLPEKIQKIKIIGPRLNCWWGAKSTCSLTEIVLITEFIFSQLLKRLAYMRVLLSVNADCLPISPIFSHVSPLFCLHQQLLFFSFLLAQAMVSPLQKWLFNFLSQIKSKFLIPQVRERHRSGKELQLQSANRYLNFSSSHTMNSTVSIFWISSGRCWL